MNEIFIALGMLLSGILVGYSLRSILLIIRKNNLELSISERLIKARETAQDITEEARKQSEISLAKIRELEKNKEIDFKISEERLVKKEELLDLRQVDLDNRVILLDSRAIELSDQEKEINLKQEATHELISQIAGLTVEEAQTLILKQAEVQYQDDLNARLYKLENAVNDNLQDRAREILISAIQRLAIPVTNELTTSSVSIESDDLKGKIIGKEGRNIRTFEKFSGVEVLVDETPGAIVVSCFDPVRRAIAIEALKALLDDGRIQPAKIEEELEKARANIHLIIKEKGSTAAYECGIYNLDPRLVAVLGRLHFRTSYGQNVLQHSIEMAHIAEILASELGADPYIAKAGALVHDIGKALDHEFEGTHVEIGVKMMRRFNTDERIITAMKSHHDDVPHESLEAVIVQVADMISGARPGARRDTTEMYLKRLSDLENIASQFQGVEKVYALQAGREIRIFVSPQEISDLEAKRLARNIALDIENQLRYPGQIKITIIRENRIVDYAR